MSKNSSFGYSFKTKALCMLLPLVMAAGCEVENKKNSSEKTTTEEFLLYGLELAVGAAALYAISRKPRSKNGRSGNYSSSSDNTSFWGTFFSSDDNDSSGSIFGGGSFGGGGSGGGWDSDSGGDDGGGDSGCDYKDRRMVKRQRELRF